MIEYFIGFGFGFSVAVLTMYKIGNNRTPLKVFFNELTPQIKHKAFVPKGRNDEN